MARTRGLNRIHVSEFFNKKNVAVITSGKNVKSFLPKSSHLDFKKITLYCLLNHTAQLLQPLDRAGLKSLKSYNCNGRNLQL